MGLTKLTTDMSINYLSELLKDYIVVPQEWDRKINGLCLDSRLLKPGDVFFAYPGEQFDGRTFIADAVTRGATAVIYEAANACVSSASLEVPCFKIPNLRQSLSSIAARFYGYPSQKLEVIGITGTNGKTTCSQLMAAALHTSETPAGIIGTLGHGLWGKLQMGTHTTPDAITTQRVLAELAEQGVKRVAMEVSSHALDQGRVADVRFSLGVFTNLTRDHLDYHQDMVAYGQAKRRLFTDFNLRAGVINADDPYGRTWLKQLHGQFPLYGYSIEKPHYLPDTIPVVFTRRLTITTAGIKAELHTPWGSGILQSQLLGRFNVSNLLAIVTVLGIHGLALPDILERIADLRPVPGRLQALGGQKEPLIIVDFAHTPDALEQALLTVREFCQGETWCIFGCGGGRDRGKRSLMGQVAEKYADHIVLTDDNPRHEDARTIIVEIMQGLDKPQRVIIEHDRRKAIAHALYHANAQDVILIAGKGHEQYQEIGQEKRPFSDALIAQSLLAQMRSCKCE